MATRRRTLGATAAVAVLALTGCAGGSQPGAAALVNGTAISQDKVDQLVQATCDFAHIQRDMQGLVGASQSVAHLRTLVTNIIVQNHLVNTAAQQMKLTVSRAAIVGEMGNTNYPSQLGDQERKALKSLFHNISKANVQRGAILQHLKNPKKHSAKFEPLTPQEVKRVQKFMKGFAKKQDVSVNPAYGRWNGTQVTQASGSLSDPVSESAKQAMTQQGPAGLPPSQTCG